MSSKSPTHSLRMVKAMIKQETGQDQTIGIPRPFIKFAGDHVSAMVLNQILYLSDSFDSEDGWFFRSREQWEDDICVTPYQLARAVKHLARFGIEKKIKKVGGAPTLHFRINYQIFMPLFRKFLENEETKQSSPISKKLDNQETSLSDGAQNTGNSPIVEKLDNQNTATSIVEKLDHPLKDQKIQLEDSESTNNNNPREASPGFTHEVHPAIQSYRDVFGVDPPAYGQDQIEGGVVDLALWRETCMQWKGNNNDATKVWNMVNAYKKKVNDNARTQGNRAQTTTGDRQQSPASAARQPPGQPYNAFAGSKRV